ncbi:hypothetical protein LINPERPRIM_LOCUS135 [Linum perenne]
MDIGTSFYNLTRKRLSQSSPRMTSRRTNLLLKLPNSESFETETGA